MQPSDVVGLTRETCHFLLMQVVLALLATLVFAEPLKYELLPYEPKALAEASLLAPDGHARFTILTPRLIRMELDPHGSFENRASLAFVNRAVSPVPKFSHSLVSSGLSTVLRIETEELRLEYVLGSGKFDAGTLKVTSLNPKSAFRYWDANMTSDQDPGNLFGTYRTLDSQDNPSLNCTLNKQQHCVFGLVSRSGWALVDDTDTPILGAEDWWTDAQGRVLKNQNLKDLYLFAHGHDYFGALQDFSLVGGKIPMIPRFAMGNWWTRWININNADLKKIVEDHESRSIPLDVFVLDMNWHKKNDWTGYTFDSRLFPDPADSLGFLKHKQLAIAANLHDASGINSWEQQYWNVRKALNRTDQGRISLDLIDRDFCMALEDIVLQPIEKIGMDFWWIDWQQGENAGYTLGDKMNPTIWLNKMRSTDRIRRGENRRAMVLARFGGLGNHRYQVGFSGDVNQLTWQDLAYQPYFSAAATNVGFGFWSHDIVGPGSNHELYLRWLQWGAFSAILRNHERGSSSGRCKDPFPTDEESRCTIVEIWNTPNKYFEAARAAIVEREKLIPYIYSRLRIAHESGISLIIPLYYYFPGEDLAYTGNENGQLAQYIFGDDIMVAPIVSPSQPTSLTRTSIWIPPGEWYEEDFGTMRFGGSRTFLSRSYDLTEIPRFTMAGRVIATIPVRPGKVLGLAQKQYEHLTFTIYASSEMSRTGGTRVYEDDAISNDYLNNAFSWTKASYSYANGDLTFKVHTEGQAPLTHRRYDLKITNSVPPTKVRVNGENYSFSRYGGEGTWSYVGDELMVLVEVPRVSLEEELTIELFGAMAEARDLLQGVRGLIRRANLAKRVLDETRQTPGAGDIKESFITEVASLGEELSRLAGHDRHLFLSKVAQSRAQATAAVTQISMIKDMDPLRKEYVLTLLSEALL